MATKDIKVKFQLIEKEELRDLLLENVADFEMKLKRAKSNSSKRNIKNGIRFFGSAAAYITELMDNEKQ